MFTEQTFAAGPRRLNFARGPKTGPPLVLLHGVLRAWQDFVPLLPALTARCEVLALDHRGHGRSERAAGQYAVADYVQDAVAFVAALPEPAVIFGHSLGAMVAAAVAAEIPERVRAIVLEDPPFHTLGASIGETQFLEYFRGVHAVAREGGDVDDLARRLAEVRWKLPNGSVARLGDVRDPASIRFSAKCLTQIDPDVLAPLVEGRWLAGYDRDAILRRIRCPVLLLQADEAAGGMLPDVDANRIGELLPQVLRVKLAGVGHLIHWTDVATTLRLTLNFLESL